jgi:tRNA pseudouridine13 synthase
MQRASEQDRALGMEYYLTDTPGCSGVLRSSPEDFQVDEIYSDQDYKGGRFLVIEVTKKDWDTHHLIREMSRRLRISQKRIGWAGTKDKRALTKQRMSIMNLDESDLERIRLPDLEIRVLGKSNRGVSLGALLGNRFMINIRELECSAPEDIFSAITEEIRSHGGLPNYFGVQRFGETRPVTHKVGEALAKGQIEEAVFIYLALPFLGEPERTRDARQELWENRDVAQALKTYPDYLRYEMAMLNYLVAHPGDYAGSFQVLSPNLQRLFIHAYQSYLFNLMLSRRLTAGLALNCAVEGDAVCFLRGDIPDPGRIQSVTEDNLQAVSRLAKRGRAFVTMPLIGYESQLAGGVEGEIERDVLDEEGIAPESFSIKENPDLSSKGSRRAVLLRVSPQILVRGNCARMEFALPPGSYATVVLREYMKSGSLMMD